MKPIFVPISLLLLAASTAFAQVPSPAQDEAALVAAQSQSLSALGQYNYNAAAADVQEQQAASIAQQNSSQALREWYARKQANSEYRAAKYPVSSPGLMTRLTQIQRPDRLGQDQYSRRTGELNWPAILQESVFDDERLAINELFAQRRAFDAGTNSQFYRQIKQLSKQMHDKMLNSIDQLTPEDSVSARKFLRSLEFEARILPGDLGGLATATAQDPPAPAGRM